MKKDPHTGNQGFTVVKLIAALLILFIVAFLLTWYYIENPIANDPEGKLRIEIIKCLLTILGVAIIGGVIAALFKSHERYQEHLKLRLQAKTRFMSKLGELYRTIKRSRRKMNANGIEASELPRSVLLNKTQITLYIEQMAVMNDVQLELEGFNAAVKNQILFSYDEKIIAPLTRMERYLRKILKEYEKEFLNLVNKESVKLHKFPYLEEFTYTKADNDLLVKKGLEAGPYYCFKTDFSQSFYAVLSNFS